MANRNSDWTPRPDPTVLTTEQLHREINSIREVLEVRFKGSDISLALLQEQIDRRFLHMQELLDTKIEAQKQLLGAEVVASKELFDIQNEANTEAAAKAEASVSKQIDQLTRLVETLDKATTDRIGEIKERIDRGEGSTSGERSELINRRSVVNQYTNIIAAAFLGLALVVSVVVAVYHK